MPAQIEFPSRAGRVVFDARKGAFLPDCGWLLVADLHFEKGSFLAAVGGSPLPALDTLDTMDRLEALIARYRPAHIVALGDSFHDIEAGARMAPDMLARMNALVDRTDDFTWILGNHDPDIPAGLSGHQEDHLEIGGFLLTHHPTAPELGGVNICGHLHPKVRVQTRRGRQSHPCWAVSQERIIMPSFGAYTGGLDVQHKAIAEELAGERAYFAATGTMVVPLAG